MSRLDKEIFNIDHLHGKELDSLARKYKSCKDVEKKIQIRDEIFRNVSKLITQMIGRSPAVNPDEFEDVFNSAVINFYNCLDHYKPKRKSGFAGYLRYWINKTIIDHCYGRNIINIGHGAFSGTDNSKMLAGKASNHEIVRLDRVIHNEDSYGSKTVHDIIPSDDAVEDVLFEKLEKQSMIAFLRKNLNPVEFVIIRYRYLEEETFRLEDFTPLLKLHRERVRQLEYMALRKLRLILQNKEDSWAKQDNPFRNAKVIPDEILDAYYKSTINARDNQRKFVLKK